MDNHTKYEFCHNRKCKLTYCLRHELNMPYNEVCLVKSFVECNESNDYFWKLLEKPEEDELIIDEHGRLQAKVKEEVKATNKSRKVQKAKENYWDIVNQILSDSGASVYIEPFCGRSKSIAHINNPGSLYGTDIDSNRVSKAMRVCGGSEKNFKAYDYKRWDMILSNESYKGKCVVLCEIPSDDSEKFSRDEFFTFAYRWSENNIILVIDRADALDDSLEVVCSASKEKTLYKVKNKDFTT